MGRKKQLRKAERKVVRLSAKLAKAEQRAERWKAEAKRLRAEAPTPAALDPTEPAGTAVPAEAGSPDTTWSLTRLRGAARERGLTGYSRSSKEELLRLLAD